jgi:hypothetical protein
MLSTKLKEAAGNSADATLYVDSVFSTYLYTGNGSTQTITNGIDLAGKGGMVWTKCRNVGYSNILQNTDTLNTQFLISNNANPAANSGTDYVSSVSATGYALGSNFNVNSNGNTYVSWTFRKAAKFFDVVTYTGTGSARTIAHSLGIAPGMIIVKCTSTASTNWQVYSNGLTSAAYSMQLNLTAAQASAPTVWNSTAPTSSVFSVGTDATVNASGGTYVAYLYAHDTSSTGIIQCGSYVGTGAAGKTVTLGWEPQYVMIKKTSSTEDWFIMDSMRGFTTDGGDNVLYPNLSNAEYPIAAGLAPTATGFVTKTASLNTSGQTYIYMAIRRPNKPPTTGTSVFNPASGVSAYGIGRSNTSPDLFATFVNKTSPTSPAWMWSDRLRGFLSGGSPIIDSTSTAAENTRTTNPYFKVTEESFGPALTLSNMPTANSIWYAFKRAPGFFDEVCYTGNGASNQTLAHNLGVAPELFIVKRRSASANWVVYCPSIVADTVGLLNSSNAFGGTAYDNGCLLGGTIPASNFRAGFGTVNNDAANASASTYVAYLFATLAGISKVGVYTGNGTGQAIACGFGSGGARFVLIKRTDSTGDWYTFDSARGLTSGSSPYLLLNSTGVEVTGNNGVYASSGGFTLGATASTTTNISGASYIFLSVS